MLLACCCAQGASSLLIEEWILLYREQYFRKMNLPALLFPVEGVASTMYSAGVAAEVGFWWTAHCRTWRLREMPGFPRAAPCTVVGSVDVFNPES